MHTKKRLLQIRHRVHESLERDVAVQVETLEGHNRELATELELVSQTVCVQASAVDDVSCLHEFIVWHRVGPGVDLEGVATSLLRVPWNHTCASSA